MSQEQTQYPDPEVMPQAKRRRFSAEYKLRAQAEADARTEQGEIGALLRREGLYSSHLDKWRKQVRANARRRMAHRQRRGGEWMQTIKNRFSGPGMR